MKDRIIKGELVSHMIKMVLLIIMIIGTIVTYREYFNGLYLEISDDEAIEYSVEGDSVFGNQLKEYESKIDKLITDDNRDIYQIGYSFGAILGIMLAFEFVLKIAIATMAIILVISAMDWFLTMKQYKKTTQEELPKLDS